MRKMRLVLAVFLVVLFANVSNVLAQQLMPLEEMERLIYSSSNRSVNAHFLTVLKGIKIESLKITIKGVVRQPGFEAIVFTSKHQIAGGMSGSPTYVNGKLVGAIAYSFNGFSDEHWGGISSISSMMADDKGGAYKYNLVSSFDYEGKTFVPISSGPALIPGFESFSGQKFISTTSSGGSELVGSGLDKPVLKPGMPIVVDLVEWTDEKGKMSTVGATGTITHIDNKGRIYAFGHPFYNSKNVVYSFRTAEIIDTIPSDEPARNFKLTGRTSGVLGAITYDSSYGIYGKVGASEELQRRRHFNLAFKNRGVVSHKFDIKVAESVMTPILVSAAFAMIGNEYGAPLSQEISVTQIESLIDLEGHQPILWKGLYPSNSIKFGSQVFYSSSFDSAREAFFSNVYSVLSSNNYGLKISNVSVSVNFIPEASQIYKVGAYKFPNKVIYGQDPVLDVLFVDENNIMPVAKRVTVKIDWDKVEKPIYTAQTNDKDKVPEKIVGGWLGIQSSYSYMFTLSREEKQKTLPKYFLNADDFLKNFSIRLGLTNQKIFTRVRLRSRSGLFDEVMAKSVDIMPTDIVADENGWRIIKEGLKERMITLVDDGAVTFYVDLPEAPSGYVFDQAIDESVRFEVVSEK